MDYYVATYIGTGTPLDPFRPVGADQLGWTAIDLRPDATVAQGRAIMAVPTRADHAGTVYLGNDLDGPSAALQTVLNTRLGVTLQANTLRQILLELLLVHARTDGTRWKPIQADPAGMYEVWLGERLARIRSIGGGSVITESFNQADSTTLGPDLSWSEPLGDLETVGNQIQNVSSAASLARANVDLLTHHHEVRLTLTQFTIPAADFAYMGPCGRFDPASVTCYVGVAVRLLGNPSNDTIAMQKFVNGTLTGISGGSGTPSMPFPSVITIRILGSSLEVYLNGVRKGAATDSTISNTAYKRAGIYMLASSLARGDCIADDFFAQEIAGPGELIRGFVS